MPAYLRFFGGARIEMDGQPVSGRAAHRRRLALLALLAAAGDTGLARERLVFFLWPDREGDAARRLLSEALYVIRKELGEGVIVASGEQVMLGRSAIDVDLWRFDRAVADVDVAGALTLYRGPFLDGWYVDDAPEFERWAEEERQRRRLRYERLLLDAHARAARQGELPDVLQLGRALAVSDPFNGRYVRLQMEGLVQSGAAAEALRTYAAHEALLRSDLGVAPDGELQRLAEAIRGGTWSAVVPPLGAADRAASVAASVAVRTPASTPASTPDAAPSDESTVVVTVEGGPGITPGAADGAATAGTDAATRPVFPRHGVRRRWTWQSIGAASALAGALALASAWALSRPDEPGRLAAPARTPAPIRIAVLYFDDHTTARTLQPLADALTEEVIAELTGVNAFSVVPRNGVKVFRDRSAPLDSIFRVLGAHALVTGSTQRDGDSLRVSVQLVDSATQSQVASASLVRPLGSLVEVERDVAQVVANTLRRRLGREVRLRAPQSGSRNAFAREHVARARRLRDEARFVSDDPSPRGTRAALDKLREADSLLAAAARADRRWQLPLIERAWTWRERAALQSAAPRAAALDSGLRLAREALALAATPAGLEVRGTLGFERSRVFGQDSADAEALNAAERDLRAALEGDSTLARAWATLSFLQWMRGSFREAALSGERALEADAFLDEAPLVLRRLFYVHLMLEDVATARDWCDRGFRALPSDWRFTECRLTALLYDVKGRQRPEHAWALVDTLALLDPAERARSGGNPYSPIFRILSAAAVSARAGDSARARAALLDTERRVRGDSALAVNRLPDAAYVAWCLGDSAAARQMISDHLRQRPIARDLIARDPLFREMLAPR